MAYPQCRLPELDDPGDNQSVDWYSWVNSEMILDEPPFASLEFNLDDEQEGILETQHTAPDQVSDRPSTSSAGRYYMPPSESQMLATIHSAYNTGTGKSLTHLQMEQVIKVGNSALVLDNFSEFFAVNTAPWLQNESQGRHALGIPMPNFASNKAACVAYFNALEFGFGQKNNVDSPLYLLSRRVMQIWLYLFFHEYVKELERDEAAGSAIERNGRQLTTVARDAILAEVYGNKQGQLQRYRAKHSDHERWGHRWWRIASCGGMGVVLLASKQLAEKMYNTPTFCLIL